jgi:hypothetical protein
VRSAEASSVRSQAIAALVVAIASTLFCCLPAGIAAIATSAVALNRVDTDLTSARSMLKWSWGLLIAGVAIGVIAIIGFFVWTSTLSTTSYN